jgi:hypothetical protein
MNFIKYFSLLFFALSFSLAFSSCDKDDDDMMEPMIDFTGTYVQADQMARPAINTVFVSDSRKDEFNETTPAEMGGKFAQAFEDRLLALNPGYTTNALGLDAPTFTGILATDVLTASLTAPTTFFDGTNVLTGRTLDDDVIDVELLLIFGGSDGTANPGLTSDNVDSNDKEFLNAFPYLASPW